MEPKDQMDDPAAAGAPVAQHEGGILSNLAAHRAVGLTPIASRAHWTSYILWARAEAKKSKRASSVMGGGRA